MKVNVSRDTIKTCPFKELSLGDVFIYEDEAWMQVGLLIDLDEGSTNAIHLETGDPSYFGENDIIIVPKHIDFNIIY